MMPDIVLPKPSAEIAEAAAAGDVDRLKSLTATDPEGLGRPGEQNATPLAYAVAGGHLDAVAYLAEQKVDVNATLADGKSSPVAVALDYGQLDVARFLVNNGSNPVLDFPPGVTPSPWASKFFIDQIAYRARSDWDGIMRDFYNEDAVMITYDFVLKTTEEIKQHFIDGNAASGKLIGFAIDHYNEDTGNLILMRSTVISEFVLTKANDTYLFRDGKVSLFSAHTIDPGLTTEWADKWLFDEYRHATIYNPIKK
jgi:hypothetical protein